MDWTALVGGERISAGLKPFGSRVCLSFCFYFLFFPIENLYLSLIPLFPWQASIKLIIRSDLNDTRDRYMRGSL